jgi:septum formation protein
VLVLASQSPRRQEILRNAGIDFISRISAVQERRADGESPIDYVRRLAREKAEAVSQDANHIVLGADTVVVIRDRVLEKPVDEQDAAFMLQALSGNKHQVITGIYLLSPHKVIEDHAITHVYFRELEPAEIRGYVATGEPMDKAGAYAIQGFASKFIHRIEGCYFNVVGLPVSLVYEHLKRMRPSA